MVYPRTESQEATRRAVELADRLLSRGVQVAVPELMLQARRARTGRTGSRSRRWTGGSIWW